MSREQPIVEARPAGKPGIGTQAAIGVSAGGVEEQASPGRIGREARSVQDPVTNVFESQSWYVAPPPEAPPRPTAPALPYVYMGKIVDDGQQTVFLIREDRSYAVKAGDTLDGTYRVEAIQPSEVTFLYLPLRQRQRLATGD